MLVFRIIDSWIIGELGSQFIWFSKGMFQLNMLFNVFFCGLFWHMPLEIPMCKIGLIQYTYVCTW